MEVVARDARDGFSCRSRAARHQVLVDDVVAHPQIGEACERSAEARVGARGGFLVEDLRIGEAARSVSRARRIRGAPGRRQNAGRVGRKRLARREERPADLVEQRSLPPFSASPRCANATTTRFLDWTKPLSLALRFGEAAGGDRGPLRLEAVRLALRKRIERRPRRGRARAPPRPGSAGARPAARRDRARDRRVVNDSPQAARPRPPRRRRDRARRDRRAALLRGKRSSRRQRRARAV